MNRGEEGQREKRRPDRQVKALGIQGSGGQGGTAGREGKSNKARLQSKCKADPEPSREFQGRVHVGRREQEDTGAYADPSGPLKPPHLGRIRGTALWPRLGFRATV